MSIVTPETARLKIVMTRKGKLRLLVDDRPLPAAKIEMVAPAFGDGAAQIMVTFHGAAVALDIERD